VIRFRFLDDEKRFVRLHAEMFEKLARAGLREGVGSETLRNVGKIEQMAYMEGLRQGLAMAAIARQMLEEEISPIPEPAAQKAFQLHALIYGSSDTPLRSVEKEWLGKLKLDGDHLAKSWLDDKPMRFAPATLQELDGTAPPIAPMMSVQAPSKPVPVQPFRSFEPDPPSPPSVDNFGGDDFGDENSDVSAQLEQLLAPKASDGEIQPESPEFLDIARDAIQTLKRGGWDPKNWQDIILGLHRHMGVDAGYLDIQLTTHFGRTVLDQCGLAGLAPPDMMSFEFLSELPGRQAAQPLLVARDETGRITDTPPVDDDLSS
jgi:hypothetical protein